MKSKNYLLLTLAALALLSNGCGILTESHHQTMDYTPVFAAAAAGNVAAVEAAIKQDSAVLKATEWDGATLLHLAVQQNHQDLAQALLQDGANVNALTTDGLTPLHMAAQNGNIGIITLLLDNKAALDPIDAKGWTPLDRANKWGHADAAAFLKQRGAHAAASQ